MCNDENILEIDQGKSNETKPAYMLDKKNRGLK